MELPRSLPHLCKTTNYNKGLLSGSIQNLSSTLGYQQVSASAGTAMGSYRGYLSDHVDIIVRLAGEGVPAFEIAVQLYHAGVRPPWSGGAVLKRRAVARVK